MSPPFENFCPHFCRAAPGSLFYIRIRQFQTGPSAAPGDAPLGRVNSIYLKYLFKNLKLLSSRATGGARRSASRGPREAAQNAGRCPGLTVRVLPSGLIRRAPVPLFRLDVGARGTNCNTV